MEFLFKRHFWIVHLLFIFGVMLMVARTANAFIESLVTPLPQPKVKAAAAPRAPVMLAGLDAEKVSKLTGVKLEKEVEVKEPVAAKEDLSNEPVHTSLRVKLLGTLVAGLPEWSIASIQDVVTLSTKTYMVGDAVQTATILDIERSRVIIKNNNRREFIDATSGDGSSVVAAPPPMAAAPVAANAGAPPSVALGNGIKATSENEYEVPRAEIDKTLSNLNDVAMQARIVPAFKDGVAQGFKLFSIRPDSIYTKIGVQNGDVLKRINGYDLNSPEKALEIYSKLKEASRIDIEIERNGSTVRKTYNVR
ncbi:MAG: general secretion pathway protein GspC [Archangiaceae bacterium]|nr:general secretion pathway protein GspC [Archangiaceae bacterium]